MIGTIIAWIRDRFDRSPEVVFEGEPWATELPEGFLQTSVDYDVDW